MGVNSFIKWYIDRIPVQQESHYPGSSVATTTAPSFQTNKRKDRI